MSTTRTPDDVHVTVNLTLVAAVLSALALVLSGITAWEVHQDDDFQDSVESRLACLELPGPNDCGLDGR
jgi:hypothetical protein